MGLPSINITFKELGVTAIQRSDKGVVAVILQDTNGTGGHSLTSVTEIPAVWTEANRAYVKNAFVGYISPPRRVLVYVIGDSEDLGAALGHFAQHQFDYLAGAPDLSAADAQTIANWIKSERQDDHMVKAVLPDVGADNEAIVNFTAEDIQAGETTYTTSEYCSRIAGLLAGTPMTVSCTYAPLPEVTNVKRMTKAELDAAIDGGKFVLFHDGEKVKVGRGVNSLVTTTQDKGASFQKIKIVEAIDMIKNDIRMTAQDNYIGKYSNSYDNKCLLIMAIKGYFEELERQGILESDSSTVEIDMAAQEAYLKSTGTDTSAMSEQEIKEANTKDKVFLSASIKILDAIEDISFEVTI